jgi:hypothetical protein
MREQAPGQTEEDDATLTALEPPTEGYATTLEAVLISLKADHRIRFPTHLIAVLTPQRSLFARSESRRTFPLPR